MPKLPFVVNDSIHASGVEPRAGGGDTMTLFTGIFDTAQKRETSG